MKNKAEDIRKIKAKLSAYQGENVIIELKDGSIINGILQGCYRGCYRIVDEYGDVFIISSNDILTVNKQKYEGDKNGN